MSQTLSFEEIQTPTEIWQEILKLNPIEDDHVFYEPFKGTGNLFKLVSCTNKYWSEIEEQRDVFDFEHKNQVTCIYSNFPFKAMIPNKKGIKSYKNCGYFFLEYFAQNFPNLTVLGSLMNGKIFQSLTPKRLQKLADLGFTIKSITCFNCTFWFGLYYFVVFEKNPTNNFFKIIPKTFTQK